MNNMYNIKLSNFVHSALGGSQKINPFSSNDSIYCKGAGWKNKLNFEIVTLNNSPVNGVTTHMTLGLSEYELKDDQNNKPPRRVELITVLKDNTDFSKLTGDTEDEADFYKDTLLYLCCYMINEKSYLFPGDTWPCYFSNRYQQFSDLEHLFFIYPTILTDKLQSTTIDGKKVEFLLCVPITQKELEYCEKNGSEALEKLIIQNNVDISDLFRKSIL